MVRFDTFAGLFFFFMCFFFFFFQAEDGIRDFCLSRGLGDVYKRQGSLLSIIGFVVIKADDHNKIKMNGKILTIVDL